MDKQDIRDKGPYDKAVSTLKFITMVEFHNGLDNKGIINDIIADTLYELKEITKEQYNELKNLGE